MRRNARILLVNPWITDFTAADFWMKPLGLMEIGRILKSACIEVDWLDLAEPNGSPRKDDGTGKIRSEIIPTPAPLKGILKRRYFKRFGLPYADAAKAVNSFSRPDLILLTSSMTYWYPGVQETIALLRRAFGATPIWLGGTYAELCPGHASAVSGADRVCGSMNAAIATAAVFESIGITPCGNWSDYSRSLPYYPYHVNSYFVTRTSSGCNQGCSCCASRLLHGPYQPREPRQSANDIAWAIGKGFRNIVFYDDALLAGEGEHLREVLERVAERVSSMGSSALIERVSFHAPNGVHGREINDNVAKLLRAWRFSEIRIGYESSDPDVHANMGGKLSPEGLARAVEYLRGAGFDAGDIIAYVLCGAPGTDMNGLFRTLDSVHELGIRASVSLYSPVPGTRDFQASFAGSELEVDPLFSNKTIHLVRSGFMTEEQYRYLKIALQGLSEAISRGEAPTAAEQAFMAAQAAAEPQVTNPENPERYDSI